MPAYDIYDPGPDASFPNMPRHPDGTVDRSRITLGPPVTHIRVDGVDTPLTEIVERIDEAASANTT